MLVVDKLTMVPEITKKIEQAGSKYEKVKLRMSKFRAREEEKKVNEANRISGKGKQTKVDSETESEEEKDIDDKKQEGVHHDEWEKKRKHRTREDIEREALLMGDLYSMLGLADRTYEAGDGEIKQSYKKLALMYHPDKLGDSITESDKQVWLQI